MAQSKLSTAGDSEVLVPMDPPFNSSLSLEDFSAEGDICSICCPAASFCSPTLPLLDFDAPRALSAVVIFVMPIVEAPSDDNSCDKGSPPVDNTVGLGGGTTLGRESELVRALPLSSPAPVWEEFAFFSVSQADSADSLVGDSVPSAPKLA